MLDFFTIDDIEVRYKSARLAQDYDEASRLYDLLVTLKDKLNNAGCGVQLQAS